MQTRLQTDWANRWLGGFCAPGFAGMPIRGEDRKPTPTLAEVLTLPTPLTLASVSPAEALTAWKKALGNQPVLLVSNPMRARALLLAALGVEPGASVGVPMHATRNLAESVKRHGAMPQFLPLCNDLRLDMTDADPALRVVWVQSLGAADEALPITTLVDASATVPMFGAAPVSTTTVYGLHLHSDERKAGALLVFADSALAARVAALLQPADLPDAAMALAQLQRLTGDEGLVAWHGRILAELQHGVEEAAALTQLPLSPTGLAHGVLLQVPAAIESSIFYAYMRAEKTPVQWLSEQFPLHYTAVRTGDPTLVRQSARHLASWMLLPAGPGYNSEDISQTVLGVVKAADYLGVRWFNNPERARWYADLMTEFYGDDHDAYRPVFDVYR